MATKRAVKQPPIRRVLVANRGEIAVRLIRACNLLDIESVAIVSDADRDSLPARMAHRSVCIGPAPSRDSYLRPDLIVHAAVATGCDALHPGYGFLAEQPALPTMCADNGVIFIGPDAETIKLMGNKLAARDMAMRCGIPLLPGSARIADPKEAVAFAEKCGYPVLIKAAAGGGGRGMKIVSRAEDLKSALQTTASEARAAFGDPTLYIERFIADARHIEVQILGDGDGAVVHLGERDCSLQRRHQKVIEEAPAPRLPVAVRDQIRTAAVAIAKAVGYRSAGTVEFLFDKSTKEFFFLEMNTRIQVEHPVTEMVTKIDIVAEQIRIAGGHSIDRTQEEIAMSGHAIEARITAEAPEDGFRPSPGRVSCWREPKGAGIRIDTQCYEGYVVPPYYDSLIAKVIAHAPSRKTAVGKLRDAIAAFEIEGIRTNKDFLIRLLSQDGFMKMSHNTRTIDLSLATPTGQE
jgi:acetyl-CoA carboxylase biotin carboxylase subunit